MSERINEVSTLGTGRRGLGAKIHRVESWSYDTTEGKHYNGMRANCNGNGQWTARDFQAGFDRQVTCLICNHWEYKTPTWAEIEDLPTPAERTPKADSCQATNKKTGKQCTFKGRYIGVVNGNRRCATHSFATPDYVAPVEVEALPVSVEGESENWTDESIIPQEHTDECGRAKAAYAQEKMQQGEFMNRQCTDCYEAIHRHITLSQFARAKTVEESIAMAYGPQEVVACEDCGHADPSNLTQLSSIDGESVYLLCFSCKDTRIQIRQLQGTPGPARLAKMFPMGKGWSR